MRCAALPPCDLNRMPIVFGRRVPGLVDRPGYRASSPSGAAAAYYVRIAGRIAWADGGNLSSTCRRPRSAARWPTRRGRYVLYPGLGVRQPPHAACQPGISRWLLSLPRLDRSVSGGIGRICRRPGSISSGNVAPRLDASGRSRLWSVTGNLALPRRPSSTTRTGPSASSSAVLGMAALACWMWSQAGQSGDVRRLLLDTNRPGRNASSRVRPRSGAGREESPPVSKSGARLSALYRKAGA